MSLTRDQIIAKRSELHRESIDVPDFGEVFIRVLTLAEVGEIQRIQKTMADSLRFYPRLISMGCVDEEGKALFEGEDVKLIEGLPWPAVDAIAKGIIRINRMGPEDNGDPKGSTP